MADESGGGDVRVTRALLHWLTPSDSMTMMWRRHVLSVTFVALTPNFPLIIFRNMLYLIQSQWHISDATPTSPNCELFEVRCAPPLPVQHIRRGRIFHKHFLRRASSHRGIYSGAAIELASEWMPSITAPPSEGRNCNTSARAHVGRFQVRHANVTLLNSVRQPRSFVRRFNSECDSDPS